MDHGWSLNDALHEFTVQRSDMSALLQPRLKMPKPAAPPIYNDTKGFKGGGKNQKGAKGKSLRSLVLDGYPKFG